MFVWLLFVFLYKSWCSHGKYTGVVYYFLLLQPWNVKTIASWQENYDKPRQRVEKQRHYSANKGPYSQDYGLSSGHVQLWKLNSKEGRAPKNWCLWTVVLEKAFESPLDSKENKPVSLKEINTEYLLEGLMQKLKFQYFCHLMWTANWVEKSLMLGKTEGKGERGDRGWDG